MQNNVKLSKDVLAFVAEKESNQNLNLATETSSGSEGRVCWYSIHFWYIAL